MSTARQRSAPGAHTRQDSTPDTAVQQLEERCIRLYTEEAPRYDQHRFGDWKGRFVERHIARLLRQTIRMAPGTRVLDVATGTGRAALVLAEGGGQVIGIDLVEAMLRAAHDKADRRTLSNALFAVANARQLPFAEQSFDVLVCLRFFHFIPHPLRRAILVEMLRVVRPGGLLVLEFVNPFYGGIGALYRRVGATRTPMYLWPSRRKTLFAGADLLHVIGTYFPCAQRVARLHSPLGEALLQLCRHFPWKHLASEKWYVLRKLPAPG